MTFKQRLEAKGWFLSQEWIDQVSTMELKTSLPALINQALTEDLHDIGEKILPEDNGKVSAEEIFGPLVLQVQKVRNVKASKANAENKGIPTLLRVFLSDGFISCSALQNGNLQKLKWNTPPGTKLMVTSIIPVKDNFLLINDSNIEVLGGGLPKDTTKTTPIIPTNGLKPPPPWVEFGQAIDMTMVARAKDLRSLEVLADSEKPLENKQFEEQRNAKIKEIVAKKVANKNKHSAPTVYQKAPPRKQPQPRSENHYKAPSRPSHHNAANKVYNLDLAESMYNLRMDPEEQPPALTNQRRGGRGGRGGRRRGGGHDSSEVQQRPSTGSTLFDFLESHLPSSKDATPAENMTHSIAPFNVPQNYYTNNHFSSYSNKPSASRGYSRGGHSGFQMNQQPLTFRNRSRGDGGYK